ncbi:7102_t:CDS:2, partial [Racocetra persica]
ELVAFVLPRPQSVGRDYPWGWWKLKINFLNEVSKNPPMGKLWKTLKQIKDICEKERT